MKHFLRLMGRLCPISNLYKTKFSAIMAVTTLFMCLIAAIQAPAQTGAAANVDEIQPLQIGDTIPEELWHLPLQVVNHPEGKETVTLNDYRGKAILLDFLSTGCSGCIAAIPKLETVASEFGDEVIILPITSQKHDQVAAFIPKNEHVNRTELSFVVEDQILKTFFPHLYISHVVWVDPIGVIRATTGSDHVAVHTVREFLSGATLDWPVKSENTPFFNAPLVTLNTEANTLPHNARRVLYYSMITGFTEGVGAHMATRQDSLMGVERISYRNMAVLDLYFIALDETAPLSNIIWQVKDESRYTPWKADLSTISKEQWYQRNARCYERVVPLGTPKEKWQKLMIQDLNNFFEIEGKVEIHNDERYIVFTEKSN